MEQLLGSGARLTRTRRTRRTEEKTQTTTLNSVGFVLIRAADSSAKSAQAPRPYRQALIKIIWREFDRVGAMDAPVPFRDGGVLGTGVLLGTASAPAAPNR